MTKTMDRAGNTIDPVERVREAILDLEIVVKHYKSLILSRNDKERLQHYASILAALVE